MKNVVWNDAVDKPHFLVEDDELQVLDWPQNHNFEEGDQVQYIMSDRIFVYRVTHVQDEVELDEGLKCVTLTRVA